MPPKKQAQLQIAIENMEEWTAFISKEGLSVIDVYSAWCGPCKAVQGLFRRIKNEVGDDLLRFSLAKADNIDYLEPYRNRSMPTFLMFAGGVLVSVVRGAMGPSLEKTIREQLSYEHKVLDGTEERKPIIDEVLAAAEVELEEDGDGDEEEEEVKPEPTHKEFTVMVIKPDAVEAGKVDEIMEKITESGIEILVSKEHHFTKEEAEAFYKQHADSDHFDELVEFMSSGPCMTLVVTKGDTGEGVVEEIRDLIGPADVEKAKEEAPESIRATYGQSTKMNAVHASDSREVASRELAFFMPKFRVPYVPGTEPPIERTLALIRPDALEKYGGAIIEAIEEAGFQLSYKKEITLTKEQAGEFYKEHEGKDFYDALTTNMSSGPMLALCLAREDAVNEWRKMLASASDEDVGEQEEEKEKSENLRKQFAVEGSEVNPLHGSDSKDKAMEEINYFFPVEHTLSLIKPSHLSERESIMAKIEESGFNVSMSSEVELTKEMAEQLYSSQKDKDFFNDLVDMMTTGPSMVMVLSKPEAVMGWRAVMGPTDPEEAKEANPSCLRSLYGKSVLENAVHGSSNKEHALQEIEQLFGPIEVLPNGDIVKQEVKADADVPKTEGEAPKVEGEAPKVEGEVPKVEGEAPTTEGEAPTTEGEAPKTEGEAPKVEGETPKNEGEVPKVDGEGEGGEAPRVEGEEPKTEGEVEGKVISEDTGEGNKADGEEEHKAEGEEDPKEELENEGEEPKAEGEEPKAEEQPKEQVKTEGEEPIVEEEEPKAEEVATKAEEEEPKVEGEEPKAEEEEPKTEDVAAEDQKDEN